MSVTLEEAEIIANGAVAKANELKLRINVAVLDTDKTLILLRRMDGAIWPANHGCQLKTVNALNTGRWVGGAQPVYKNGVLVAGCGVGGGSGNEDEICAIAGATTIK